MLDIGLLAMLLLSSNPILKSKLLYLLPRWETAYVLSVETGAIIRGLVANPHSLKLSWAPYIMQFAVAFVVSPSSVMVTDKKGCGVGVG